MFKIVALSRTTASTEGHSNAVLTSTPVISSDFCPLRNLPRQERAGGLELFSVLFEKSFEISLSCLASKIRPGETSAVTFEIGNLITCVT